MTSLTALQSELYRGQVKYQKLCCAGRRNWERDLNWNLQLLCLLLTRFLSPPLFPFLPPFLPPFFSPSLLASLPVVPLLACLLASALPSGQISSWELWASLQLVVNQNRGRSSSFLMKPFNGQSKKQLSLTCQLRGSVWLSWIMRCFTEWADWDPVTYTCNSLQEWEISMVPSYETQGLFRTTLQPSQTEQHKLHFGGYFEKTEGRQGRFGISKRILSMQNSLLTWSDKPVTVSAH